jgi:hypothetical protein
LLAALGVNMIVLGNEGGEHITIGPIGRVSRDGWFQSPVKIKVNGFEGHINSYFETQDIGVFQKQLSSLYDTLRGVAELKPTEGQFGFSLTGDGQGHIEVKGYAYSQASYGSCLEFEFNIDQTHLPKFISSIQKVLDYSASNT